MLLLLVVFGVLSVVLVLLVFVLLFVVVAAVVVVAAADVVVVLVVVDIFRIHVVELFYVHYLLCTVKFVFLFAFLPVDGSFLSTETA